MRPGLVVKLRPTGPWRSGPSSGARDQVDTVYHSDSLYSAVCGAMVSLGMLEDWLHATAYQPQAPAVRFSSCFPFQDEIGYVVPPATIWPPLPSAKVRWKSAKFIPLGIVKALLSGHIIEEERWIVDAPSECLTPAGRTGPFRTLIRSGAAIDRMSGSFERHATACIEFASNAGLWTIVSFADLEQQARWSGPVRSAFRLLADSGFGGKRSNGWGRSAEPEFVEGTLPEMILDWPDGEQQAIVGGYWLLSLFTPSENDTVDWQRGNYRLVTRGGRVESTKGSGELKKALNMVAEGSVLAAAEELQGAAPNVAPDGFAHPVFRAGFAVAIPIPMQVVA